MGRHRNGRVFNAVAWATVAVLTALTGAYVVSLLA